MANKDNPSGGFKPYTSPGSGAGQPITEYLQLAAANTEIGIGTPVTWSGGYIDIGAPAGALCGVSAEYKAANSGGYIAVWNDPQQRFTAQCDDGTTIGGDGTRDGIGLNCPFVGTGVSGLLSTAELDESDFNTTATDEFKILDLSPELSGEDSAVNSVGEFVRYICKINNHQFASHTGTAGT